MTDEQAKVTERIKVLENDNTLMAFSNVSNVIQKATEILPTRFLPILKRLRDSYSKTTVILKAVFGYVCPILSEFIIKSDQIMEYGMNDDDRKVLLTLVDQLDTDIIKKLGTVVQSSKTDLTEIYSQLLFVVCDDETDQSVETVDVQSRKMVGELCRAVHPGQNSIFSAYAKVRTPLDMIDVDPDMPVSSVLDALHLLNMADAYLSTNNIQNIKQVLSLQ